jgi:hypothetical protein
MKVVIIPLALQDIKPQVYLVKNDNSEFKYDKPVHSPIHCALARTMQKGEEIKVIYILTKESVPCEDNLKIFKEELEAINAQIGANLSYDIIEIEYQATNKTYNKLINDLTEKIPENAEIFADATYGFKPFTLALFCAFRFVEEFRDAIVQYLAYGKPDRDPKTNIIESAELFDTTSLYYLFKLIGSMGATDFDTASKTLKDFFNL